MNGCTLIFCFLALVNAENWAVLVNSSQYWYDYRHSSNLLAMYQALLGQGFKGSNIIVMNAAAHACDARNVFSGHQYALPDHKVDINSGVPVDYRGKQVGVQQVLDVLGNRHHPAVPNSKRLLSDAGSKIVVYLTGHGGNGFLKFRDRELLFAEQLAAVIDEMHLKSRYSTMLVLGDTCQAETLVEKIRAPNIYTMASSRRGESSFSLINDPELGVALIDEFSYVLAWLLAQPNRPSTSMSQLASGCGDGVQLSTPVLRGPANDILMADFFFQAIDPIPMDDLTA